MLSAVVPFVGAVEQPLEEQILENHQQYEPTNISQTKTQVFRNLQKIIEIWEGV